MKPRVLVIAGSDSSAGAGVDADRDALLACAAEPLEVVTAWTRQDDAGVYELGAVDPNAWLEEARVALGSSELGAVKFGLLPGRAAVVAAASFVQELRAQRGDDLPIVLDPLIESSSGYRFLEDDGLAALLERMLPLGVIWTPNLAEAAALTGRTSAKPLQALAARESAARQLVAAGARAVILKGGHGAEDPAQDLVCGAAGGIQWLEHARIPGAGIRGSGCRFASALAAGLARGEELGLAARGAGEFVLRRILEAERR